MDIKDSILSIPYGEIKEYVDTRIQFNELISNKKYRTILDEIDNTLNRKQDILKAGKNITINKNTISAKEYTKGHNIDITDKGVVSAKGYVFNESNTSFSQGIGTITRNTAEHAEGKYNKSNIIPVFVDLGLSVKWASANIGATCGDTVESWYGEFYAWGETETKSDYSWATYKYANGDYNKLTKYCPTNKSDYWNGTGSPDGKTILDAVDDIAAVEFGSNYRMPTKEEIEELIALPNQWVTNYNGVSGLNGRVFTGTNGNTLFIPAAGFFNGSPHFTASYDCCYLWSSSLNSDNPSNAWYLNFDSVSNALGYSDRYIGFSVRCVSRINIHTHNDHPLYTQQSIGVGTSEQHRQNAVEVMDDGSVYIKGVDLFDGTNPHESYSLQQIINTLLKERIVLSAHINSLNRKVSDLLHTLYEPKVKFIDLGLSVKWAQHNEGVDTTQLSTAAAWYGNYYAWGETITKTEYNRETYGYYDGVYTKYNQMDGKTCLEKIDDVYESMFYKYFQYQYRMPTSSEIQELIGLPNKYVTNFKDVSNLNGRIFARTQSELDGTFNDDTMLFIPASGFQDGTFGQDIGLGCFLWSSSLTINGTYDLSYALFCSRTDNIDLVPKARECGLPVRCVSTDYIVSKV